MSMMIYRGGPGSVSSAQVGIDKSGQISLITGLMDVGEGASTVLTQMAADVLGVNYEDVSAVFADTASTPNAPITAGSTATFSTGTAVVEAATELRQQLLELAADGLEAPVQELETGEGFVLVKSDPARRMSISDVASRMASDFLSASSTITPGSTDYIVNSFGAHFAEVEVDTDTGRVRVLRYVAAHDSGRIINPQTALNQVEGGISQMLGFALSEELVTDGPTGVTLNASYLEHKSPTILDYPDIQVIFADVVDPVGPLGAKALGEVPSVGVAPAIANAIYDAMASGSSSYL
jgi:CO/xanthine dehydrogenase Mo-binding subunit